MQRFITYNKGIQRYAAKLTPELLYGGVGLSERWDARRVVTIRTSRDGCRWEPDDPDWSRRGTQVVDGVKRFGGPMVPPEYQIIPDDQDPPRPGVLCRLRVRVRGALLHEHVELRPQPAAGGLARRPPPAATVRTSTPSGGSAATGCAGSVRSAKPTRSRTGWPSSSTTRWSWTAGCCSTSGTWDASPARGRCCARPTTSWARRRTG